MIVQLKHGDCYVGGRGNEVFVRQITGVRGYQILYTQYLLSDGGSIGDGNCEDRTFRGWITRAATGDEIARLHRSAEHDAREAEHLDRMHDMIVGWSRVALSDAAIITDEMLLAEARGRGLI